MDLIHLPAITRIRGYVPQQPILGKASAFGVGRYVYSPLFALLLVPFTWLPYGTALLIWEICNLAFLAAAVYALLRAGGKRPSVLIVVIAVTALSFISVVRTELFWAQADLFVLFSLCVAFWLRQERRPVIAGLFLALACLTKPALLVFLPFLLWKREFRFATAAVGFFVALFLGPIAWLGGRTLSDQLAIWNFWSNQYVTMIDNTSLKSVFARLFAPNPVSYPLFDAPMLVTALWLITTVLVLVPILAFVQPQPLRNDARSIVEIGLVITAMLLISPFTEYEYLTLLIIPMLSAYMYLSSRIIWKDKKFRTITAFTIVLSILMYLPLHDIEWAAAAHMGIKSAIGALYVLLAVPYLYVLVAYLLLQIVILRHASGQRLLGAIRRVPRSLLSPPLQEDYAAPRIAAGANVRPEGGTNSTWS